MGDRDQLQATVDSLVQAGKGILAADESGPTIAKRFKAIGVEPTEENRRAYRSLLLGTPGLGAFISGVILYEETLGQRSDDGTPLPELVARLGLVPGIKVDAGTIALAHAPGDEITQGLDGLAKRRAVYNVSDTLPSRLAIEANADVLARYAAICHNEDFVPIVEPEMLMDGGHTLERCAEVTAAVLHAALQPSSAAKSSLASDAARLQSALRGPRQSTSSGRTAVAERRARASCSLLTRTWREEWKECRR